MEKIDFNFIDLFGRLAALAERHNVTSAEWANAARVAQPRITELRNAYKLHQLNVPVKAGRSCSFGRIHELLTGLRKVLGNSVVDKELLEEAKKEPDKSRKLMLLSLIITTSSEEQKDVAIQGMTSFIEKISRE